MFRVTLTLFFIITFFQDVEAMSSFNGSKDKLDQMAAKDYFVEGLQGELAEAVANGYDAEIKKAIDMGADVNYIGKKGMTPLMWGIVKESYEGVLTLLKYNADPNISTDANNVMQMASMLGDSRYLNLLIQHGGDVNTEIERSGRTIIFEAALNNRIDNIKLLVKHGANIDHKNISGSTVLHDAVTAKSYEVAVALVKLGAKSTIKDRWGYDVLSTLKQYGDKGVEKGSENYSYYKQLMELLTD